MKNLFTILLLLTSAIVLSQTFKEGYKKGYEEGYCYGISHCTPPLSPMVPMPSLGQDTYTDGYNLGFLEGKKSNEPIEQETYETIHDADSNGSMSEECKVSIDKCLEKIMKYVDDLDAIHIKLLELSVQEFKEQNYRQAQAYFELSLYKRREGITSADYYLFGARCYAKLIAESEEKESAIILRALELLNKAKNNGAENTDEVRQAISDAIKN
ncbi:hypothetical protein [Nonlabens sp. Asnod3-H03]|uniref:hypothetical protein n=1 Tax=Nonlabens sp. Asnod3-H03 TaxID=3160580 RepID=UPI00386C71E5